MSLRVNGPQWKKVSCFYFISYTFLSLNPIVKLSLIHLFSGITVFPIFLFPSIFVTSIILLLDTFSLKWKHQLCAQLWDTVSILEKLLWGGQRCCFLFLRHNGVFLHDFIFRRFNIKLCEHEPFLAFHVSHRKAEIMSFRRTTKDIRRSPSRILARI